MIKKESHYNFGEKIRKIREQRGLTMKTIAAEASISESMVSQIERNKVSPSIDTLLAIAEALDIDIEYLFRDYKRKRKVSIIRRDERKTYTTPEVVYEQLSVLFDQSDEHSIEAFLLKVAKGGKKGSMDYGHTGKELGYVIKGEGELVYGNTSYELRTGDSISFSSDIPHSLINTGDCDLEAVWVITPPKMKYFKN